MVVEHKQLALFWTLDFESTAIPQEVSSLSKSTSTEINLLQTIHGRMKILGQAKLSLLPKSSNKSRKKWHPLFPRTKNCQKFLKFNLLKLIDKKSKIKQCICNMKSEPLAKKSLPTSSSFETLQLSYLLLFLQARLII